MITTSPRPVKLWGRGQLTIPKEVRDSLGLDKETQLNVFTIGRCLILTPKRLLRTSLAKNIETAMKKKGLSLDDILRSLREERKRYNREIHGR